jgi:xanthine dehydrogenase small subunit
MERRCRENGLVEIGYNYLRSQQNLMGSKEGCASGDCGACTVLVGRQGTDAVVYTAVNACICPIGSLQDCHIVTVEGLAPAPGTMRAVFVRPVL